MNYLYFGDPPDPPDDDYEEEEDVERGVDQPDEDDWDDDYSWRKRQDDWEKWLWP